MEGHIALSLVPRTIIKLKVSLSSFEWTKIDGMDIYCFVFIGIWLQRHREIREVDDIQALGKLH